MKQNPLLSLRLKPAQMKRLERAALARGFELHDWARATLLDAANLAAKEHADGDAK